MGVSDMEHLPEAVAGVVTAISDNVGVPADQARVLLCLLAALPLGVLHRGLPSASLRHAMSALFGWLFIFFVIGWGVVHSMGTSAFVYLLAAVLPRKHLPTVVGVFSLLYMSAAHIYRMKTDYLGWHMDFTGPQMMITIKFMTFAFDLADGDRKRAGKPLASKPWIASFREQQCIETLPSPLEYFGFVYFYASVITGPAFLVRDYLVFTDRTVFRDAGLPAGHVPSSLWPTVKQVLMALSVYAGIIAAGYFPLRGYIDTPVFYEQSFLYRQVYLSLAVAFFRFTYYFAWYLGEAGFLAAGFGFRAQKPKSGKKDAKPAISWDGNRACNWWLVEFAPNISSMVNNWNMSANVWLKHYVFNRVPGSTLVRTVVTRTVSAIWHGFYPGYYGFFVSSIVVDVLERQLTRIFKPLVSHTDEKTGVTKTVQPWKALHLVLGFLVVWLPMGHFGTAFAVLELDLAWKVWKSLYFVGHWGPLALAILLQFVPTPGKLGKSDLKKVN